MVRLDAVDVSASAALNSIAPYTAPQTVRTVDAPHIAETINLVDTEDAVKYLPSLFLRKRNYGDTQATLATRVWGVSSSARSLVYADGILLSALIANNNNIGAPRWGLVAPAEIERIDVLYGPFSAAYGGNSMGAVMEITTRQPAQLEIGFDQTEAWQTFSLYGTKKDFSTHQSAITVGDRIGAFSFWVSANFQDSESQPLSFVTASSLPSGTTGGYIATNKVGAPADIVGASGLLHSQMENVKVKLAYDLTSSLTGAYTYGFWHNNTESHAQTYLRDSSGALTFRGISGFASGVYDLSESHSLHSFSVRTRGQSDWNFSGTASFYHFDNDEQRSPTSASLNGTSFGSAGKLASLDGTAWFNVDLKGSWQAGGPDGSNALSFGLHDDRYRLANPTYNTTDWLGGPAAAVATEGDGKTRTQAMWAQDSVKLSSNLRLTAGARFEQWHAYDGYNANGATRVTQPDESAKNISPKAVLSWQPSSLWTVTGSIGQAYRYATASELYQLVSTGATFTAPNPNLKPDEDVSTELRVERATSSGRVQLALFQDEIHDAIISQYLPLVTGSSQLYSYLSNVDHVRARGVEAVLEQRDAGLIGLDFSGSVTYLDARTLALSGRASPTAPAGAAVGKRLPNIPDWRATVQAAYRFHHYWTISVAGRYSAKMFTTLDNADSNTNTYQGFSAWFVADVRAQARVNDHCTIGFGVDNVFNRKYFLFHPFPQRTFVADVKLAF